MTISDYHILNRQTCSPQETRRLIKYLKATPVPWVADKIEKGSSLLRGEIRRRDNLGSLTTIFSELGGIFAKQMHGREKFLVKEVLPALRDPKCTDTSSRLAVERYMKLDASNLLEIVITIYCTDTGYFIVDGNKRASACYEERSVVNFAPISVYFVS